MFFAESLCAIGTVSFDLRAKRFGFCDLFENLVAVFGGQCSVNAVLHSFFSFKLYAELNCNSGGS